MSLDQVSAIVAVVSAIVAVLVMVFGFYERRRAFDAQQEELKRQSEQWKDDFEARTRRDEVLLRKEFLLEHFRLRVSKYGPVLRTLGAVSDVELRRRPESARELQQNRKFLTSTADSIRDHLYGEAGLLMTMTTRNALHVARAECLTFRDAAGMSTEVGSLADAFFYARRYLRADLELLDDRTPENLEKLAQELSVEVTT